MKKTGNGQKDRHNQRAAEFAKAADAYIADKGGGDTALEAAERAAKANKVEYQPKIGNYRRPRSR